MPAFSVIVPAYNCAKYLPECVESVLGQTCRDFELIVVDDGSTDATPQVMEPYTDRLTYVRQDNAGCAAARNHGIRLATGTYLAFLDADDVWLPHKLEQQLACFGEHPQAGLVHGGHLRIGLDGTERPSRRDPARLLSGRIFQELFFKNTIAASSVVVRRDVIDKVGPFDESMINAQDIEMWLRVAHDYECHAVRDVVMKFRSHATSNSRDRDGVHECVMRIVKKAYHNYKESAPFVTEQMYRTKMAEQHVKMSRNLLRHGERKRARKMAARAMQFRPGVPALFMYIKTYVG